MPKLIWTQNSLMVVREKGDPKFYGTGGAKGESHFLHWLKGILNADGHNLIKKRMWKDGHLVDDMQQYLRVRSLRAVHKGAPNIALMNNSWAIRGLNDDWNDGQVILGVIREFLESPAPESGTMAGQTVNA